MLDECKDNQARWQAVETLVQGWLKERREVLVKYAAIAANVSQASDPKQLEPGLARLCQILVDYVSAGHFEVFHQLIREAEAFADGSDSMASTLIAQIGDTTEVILGFDDKYPASDGGYGPDYEEDLSLLGEMLERRFELEDRLITGLHTAHARGA